MKKVISCPSKKTNINRPVNHSSICPFNSKHLFYVARSEINYNDDSAIEKEIKRNFLNTYEKMDLNNQDKYYLFCEKSKATYIRLQKAQKRLPTVECEWDVVNQLSLLFYCYK
ncbi:hypothetical protein HOG98_08295 [bacterium]|jgi:hypothetical protein|nr:hypothetical protein [bacterium]